MAQTNIVTDGFGNPVLDGFGNPVGNPSFNDPNFHSDSSSDNNLSGSNTITQEDTATNTSNTSTEQTGLTLDPAYAKYVGQSEDRVVDGIEIPDWVDNDYLDSYVISAKQGNPRKPNNREMTEMIAGVPIEQLYGTMEVSEWQQYTNQSSNLLYGVVGSNTDTRDWQAITSAATDPATGKIDGNKWVAATQIATSQMYGGTTVAYQSGGYQTDEAGNTVMDTNGKPVLLPPSLYVVGGNGSILTSLSTNADQMATTLQNFGVQDASWIDTVSPTMGNALGKYQSAFDTLKETYNPFADYQDLLNLEGLITGVNPIVDNFKIISGQTLKKDEDKEPTKVVEETITAPQSTAVTPGTVATPEDIPSTTPQVLQAVPATTYTPVSSQVTPQTVATNVVTPASPATTGTMGTPLQTAGLSAVPSTIQVNPNVTGTTMANITSQSQAGFGGVKKYRDNATGLEMMISVDGQGNPLTMVPPGYTQVQGQSEGGSVSENSPDVMLARKFLGFNGPASQLTNFLNANPPAAARMGKYQQAMSGMAQNRVGAQTGVTGTSLEDFQKMQQNLITQTMQPTTGVVSQITPQAADFVAPTAGQASPVSPMANVATVGTVQQSATPTAITPGTMTAQTAATDVATEAAKFTPQVGTIQPGAIIPAQQQLTTSVSGMESAQGTATMVNAPDPREIQQGEIIDIANDVAGQAQKAATFNEQIQAATATPSKQATVAGQLEGLMAQFEGGNTPSWAAGAMRAATATMAARGLGASSMAGQAIVQAAMESALPIAQMDASVMAQFEAQNLSNRQQRAILAAQQRAQFLGQEFDQAFQARVQNSARIGDIANLNFTAEQQIALEDSRAANTVNLSNLSNNQALVMAEAAALSQLDTQNLNNRQQTAVQNAQNFLQMDMTNLANAQQTELFKTQQNIQALFTDQAARNAAEQFNATSENQTNQFFANLSTQTSQFNAAQQNAMDQFNVNTTNAMRQFNSEVQQQRDLFNAQNGLVIAQANAQWRQNLATVNTAAINQANMDFAKTINAMSMKNLDEIWQRERDIMSFAFTSDQSAMDRALKIILGDKKLEEARLQLDAAEDAADTELAMRFLFGTSPTGILGSFI
tara:strand:- start:1857 stop:5174 length:3318 start_codon:yes stop_codon:yes gene_type:complete